jgi:DNA-binding response OmpR family regulator
MPSGPPRVLIVEDEAPIRQLLRLHFELAGFRLDEADDGKRGLARARTERFDLIVLDVMLPGIDGVSVCRAIRSSGPNAATPILMVTARDSEADTVMGLESGADDYLAKPFGVRELMARVSALLRRHARAEARGGLVARDVLSQSVSLDPERRQVVVRGRPVELTRQEFDLLYVLATRPGIVFSRTALLEHVWHGDTYVTERTVDAVISRLRKKIEQDPQDPALLLTAWGVGYKFADVE